ncbi:MAG: alginate lyase family protein [Thalassotalea sp.]
MIDTLHLVEVARGAKILMQSAGFPTAEQTAIKAWFSEYLTWMNPHPFGKTERDHPNNHGVCWSLQAATLADLVGDHKQKAEYFSLWQKLEADPTTYEVLRNLPVRHPLLWMK